MKKNITNYEGKMFFGEQITFHWGRNKKYMVRDCLPNLSMELTYSNQAIDCLPKSIPLKLLFTQAHHFGNSQDPAKTIWVSLFLMLEKWRDCFVEMKIL